MNYNANCLTRERVDALATKIDKELPSGSQYVWELPDGYQFVDENGNVINATKIVLEKKKDVNLTQEQINKMVYDSCVLFCKHCGCGIPRETCTSLGTCKEHDEYRDAIRTHLMEKKKTKHPKTYKECCEIIGFCSDTLKWDNPFNINRDTHPYIKHLDNLLESFCKLLICRYAYWKIAGDEMRLGKPWEPDWGNVDQNKHCIRVDVGDIILNEGYRCQHILAFSTKEMRDAFYENFKEEIEICKELL